MSSFVSIQRHQMKLLINLLLILTILVAYWQVQNIDFVGYDDELYVTENRNVQEGLTVEGLTWAFTTSHAGNWHPLTWLSHMLDCELYRLNPMGHHWTNLQFHIANTLLLFFILQQMTGALWGSAFVAALFALHPLHVESVAWVAERKDVLSAFFGMLTILAYYRYVKNPRLISYLLVILFLSLGLMAKPMLVTFPFVLLLLDFWPLKRFQYYQSSAHTPLWKKGAGGDFKEEVHHIPPLEKGDTGGFSGENQLSSSNEATGFDFKRSFHLILEKIPLLIPVSISSFLTYMAQHKAEAVYSLEALPLKMRMANAFVSYVSYVIQAVWPHKLAIFYPHPFETVPVWQVLGAGLLVTTAFFFALRASKQYPYVAVGWLWYIGTLVPVIGLLQVGAQAMADRYTYIPLTGLFIIMAWGIPDLLKKWPYRKILLGISAIIILSALTARTSLQVSHWKNSATLFENALQVTHNNWLAHNNLGIVLYRNGKIDEAISHYEEALRIKPSYLVALDNLGIALFSKGDLDGAVLRFTQVLHMNPGHVSAHNNLAAALISQGKLDEAVSHCREVLRINPDYAGVHNNLGNLLAVQGKLDEAISQYEEALRISPEHADAHYNLGRLLIRQGKIREGMGHFTKVLKINPDYAWVYNEAGIVLAQQGQLKNARAFFSKALQLNPDYAEPRKNISILNNISHSNDKSAKYDK